MEVDGLGLLLVVQPGKAEPGAPLHRVQGMDEGSTLRGNTSPGRGEDIRAGGRNDFGYDQEV